MTATLIPFTPAPDFPHYPAPAHFERADTHARLILSQAQELLLKLIEEAARNSHAIDTKYLVGEIKAKFADLAGDISGAFGFASDSLPEGDE